MPAALSSEQVDPCQLAQCPVARVFLVARDAGVLTHDRRQVAAARYGAPDGQIGNGVLVFPLKSEPLPASALAAIDDWEYDLGAVTLLSVGRPALGEGVGW
jgi:hypothetical protein